MSSDLTHTISGESTTAGQVVTKFDRMAFGKTKRQVLNDLPTWGRVVGLSPREEDLLGQIIRRSRIDQPWVWEDCYGVGRMAEYFGMAVRTFRRVVTALTKTGAIVVEKLSRSHRIYRIPMAVINQIQGRGDTGSNRPSWPIQENSHQPEPEPEPLQTLTIVRDGQGVTPAPSNRSKKKRSKRKRFPLKRSAPGAGRSDMSDFDDTPSFGADPDRVRDDPAKGTRTTQFARYFDEAWAKVEPEKRRNQLNWPLHPWSTGQKQAFMGWTKRVLLPGLNDNLPLAMALVDEFCANHEAYFSPYQNWVLWKQFNRNLERIHGRVVQANPEFQPDRQEALDPATMARHAERRARWQAQLDGLS